MTGIRYGMGILAMSGAALLVAATAALATEGASQNGYGARDKAMAGAGAADSRDANAISVNPAGLVNAGNELDLSASVFMPSRGFTGSGAPGFTPTGTFDSRFDDFLLPNISRNWKFHDNPLFDAFALSMYGNGGNNTTYGAMANPACGGGTGVYCGGKTGVNLQQIFLSAGFAKKFGGLSVGVAPILGIQRFAATGLAAFGGVSVDPADLTNRGTDTTFGVGVKGGIQYAVTPAFRLGLAGTTPIWSQKMTKYAGLFENGGTFNVPGSVQPGIAVDLNRNVTFLADYKKIYYSGNPAISDPSTLLLSGGKLGAAGGPGFGWSDVSAIKLGLEWRSTEALTLRAGFSHNTDPVHPADVMFNILAPGTVQNHFTGGLAYKISKDMDFELAGMYAPKTTVTGFELPGFGNPAHQISVNLSEVEVTAGIKYRFGN